MVWDEQKVLIMTDYSLNDRMVIVYINRLKILLPILCI